MLDRLCEVYAKLPGAADPPLLDELIKVIADRVDAFVQSTVKGVRTNPAAALLASLRT
jgi:hypothetical protein